MSGKRLVPRVISKSAMDSNSASLSSSVSTLTVPTLGEGYLSLPTTSKASVSIPSSNDDEGVAKKKKLSASDWNPFVTRRTSANEDGKSRSFIVTTLKPWRVCSQGRTTHLTCETSYPEIQETDDSAVEQTLVALSNTKASLYPLLRAYTEALILSGEATETSSKYFEVAEDLVQILQQVFDLQTQASDDPSCMADSFKAFEALLDVNALSRIAGGRLSLWHLSSSSITASGFAQAQAQDPWTNFCQVFTRHQLFDVATEMLGLFGLTQSAEPRPLSSDMHANYVAHGQTVLFQKELCSGQYQRMSMIVVAQMKGGPQGSDWSHSRERHGNFREELENMLSGAGLPLLNIPTCVSLVPSSTKKFDNLGNFQVWMSKCSLDDLLKLHDMPLYLPNSKKVDPARPKAAVSKLVNTAAIQTFFAVVIGYLFAPLTPNFAVSLA